LLLHIGAERSIAQDKVLVILDIKTVKKSALNREYLKQVKGKAIMVATAEEDVKSVIITEEKIYLSAISSLTLKKRIANPFAN